MHERDLVAEHADPRLGVDRLGAPADEVANGRAHVVDLVRHVVHAGPVLGEELSHRRVLAQRGQKLDAAAADDDRRCFDALLLDLHPALEPAAEEPLVRRDGFVEVGDGEPDMMDPACLHCGDRICETIVWMRTRTIAVLFVASLAVLVGAGPGGEASKTPAQVLADIHKATASATSVHFAGTINAPGSKIVLDLNIERGVGGAGRIAENNLVFDIVRVGDKVYLRGNDAFYKKYAGSSGVKLFHGRWLAFPTTMKGMSSFLLFTDIDQFFAGLLSNHGVVHNDGLRTFHGQKVVVLHDTSKGGDLYVAASGPAYLVAIAPAHASAGLVTFDGWNKTYTIAAPKGAIDMTKLKPSG
jgi:hypothetical protein